jgi:hypothetical protein
MATTRSSSSARIRYRPVGVASSLMEARRAGPVFELPVSGPVHAPVTVAEEATPATDVFDRHAGEAPAPVMNHRQRQRHGLSGASVSTTPGQNSAARSSW